MWLPEVVERFHQDNPQVNLKFINCSDLQLREELNSGRIDLAFLLTDAIYFKEVNVRLLKTENLIFISGPTHPFARQENIRVGDLNGKTVLLPKTD